MTSTAFSYASQSPRLDTRDLRRFGQQVVLALYDELELWPKPGLVSFVDSGSHVDMDARTFMRSLFALRHTFPALALRGAEGAPFAALESEGIAAEGRMLCATNGINTHRGAIFTLGLLCAAAGRCTALGLRINDVNLRNTLLATWGADLSERAQRSRNSNGSRVAQQFGLRSVGMEAADGFPVLFETVWPCLREALERGASPRLAKVEALFAAMAVLDDTNLVHRGGLEGLCFVQHAAHAFLDRDAARRDIEKDALSLHHELVIRRLSPGGSADLLAAACWLQRVTTQS